MASRVRVLLPRPHTEQIRLKRSTAKRKVVTAGRRSGKTTGLALLAVEAMLAGYRVLEAAPIADQTNSFWENCKRFLAEPIAAGIVYKNESDRVLQLPSIPVRIDAHPSALTMKKLGVSEIPTLPRIKCKTAWDADSLRGDWADFLLLDEYSLMSPDVWSEVGAPMLLDNDGNAIFTFTPKRKNHAFKHYVRGLSDETGRWKSFHFTSMANPHLSLVALKEITEDLTEDAYRQEILAEFLDNEGAVFRNIQDCTQAPENATPEHHRGHRLMITGDWGQMEDYTAFSVGCCDCRQEVALDRFRGVSYEIQKERLKALYNRWKPDYVVLELNSIGLPIFQALEADPIGMPLLGVNTTGVSKPQWVQNLALTLENREWQFLPDPVWRAELEAYEGKMSPTTGRISYSAPEGMHDDTVIVRMILAFQSRNLGGLLDVF